MLPLPPIQIVRANRRTLSLHVLPDKSLLVKAPLRITEKEIYRFIENNSTWIEKKMETIEKRPKVNTHKYLSGERFLYLGKEYTLAIGNYPAIKIEKDFLLFPDFLAFRIEKEITAWYIKQAKELITERVTWYAEQLNVSYVSLSFSDTKSKWGSCTQDNRLQFNWRLVLSPILVLSYVVVHELAHTKEKNHSLDFWRIVRQMNPTYRHQRQWLKENGDMLFLSLKKVK